MLSTTPATHTIVTPRLDLGVHFTFPLADVVAVQSPALLQADNSNGLQGIIGPHAGRAGLAMT
jgi:hypothetical protein